MSSDTKGLNVLAGFRGISLRQVVEADMPFLFRLFTDPGRSHLWLRGRRVYDEAGFHRAWSAWTSEEMAAKFIVQSDERPVGLVFDHDRNTDDGWTKATTLLQEESVGFGCGAIATALFMDWLFEALPFRKVYHEVYGYNAGVVRSWRKLGLVEEGVLKADRFWNGAYWDLHIFALYREAHAKIRPRILPGTQTDVPSAAAGQGPNGKEVDAARSRADRTGSECKVD